MNCSTKLIDYSTLSILRCTIHTKFTNSNTVELQIKILVQQCLIADKKNYLVCIVYQKS